MSQKFRSYVQGIRNAARELGDEVPSGMEEGDESPINEDAGELDGFEYLRGQVAALLSHATRADKVNSKIANDELNAIDDETHALKVVLRRLIKASLGVEIYTETEEQEKADLRLRTAILLAQRTLGEDRRHD